MSLQKQIGAGKIYGEREVNTVPAAHRFHSIGNIILIRLLNIRREWSGPVTIEDPYSAVTYLTLTDNATIWAVFDEETNIPGDVNSDGADTIMDALRVAQYYVGLPVSINVNAADTNCDGNITILDALMIARYYVGLITQFC